MKLFRSFIVFLLFASGKIFAQDTAAPIFHLDSLPAHGMVLDKGWKFHPGDDTAWARPNFADRGWENINPAIDIHYLPQVRNSKICWFRLQLQVGSSLVGKPLALVIHQIGASEIYLNGKLVKRFGQVGNNSKQLQTFNPRDKPLIFQFTGGVQQVFAIRYAIERNILYFKGVTFNNLCFRMQLQRPDKALESYTFPAFASILSYSFQYGIYLLLTIIHLFFFLYYPARKVNLYFSIYTFAESITFIAGAGTMFFYQATQQFNAQIVFVIAATVNNIFLIISVYKLLNQPTDIYLKSIIVFCILCVPFMFWPYEWSGKSILLSFIIAGLGTVRLSILAIKRKQPGATIVLTGQLISILSFIIFAIINNSDAKLTPSGFIIFQTSFNLAFLCPAVFISILLGREFAQTYISLKQQFDEVEKLSRKTIAQEKEKQQILAAQNITLDKQVQERTAALSQSLKELKDTQAQLIQSEKMASLGELTAGIAHEIQNPLNFVNNFSEVSVEMLNEIKGELHSGNKDDAEAITEDIIQNLEKVIHHGKRADAIVKGMLQHSRISTGQKEPTDINALADEYLRLSYHGLRAKDKSFNAIIQTYFDDSIGKVNIVPQDIGRVLLNLFNNAFYAVTEKNTSTSSVLPEYEPTVSVSTKKLNDKIEIKVSDNGVGIPQKVLDKIFQPFFTTKPTGQGTGLGLSLSYDIIKAHGGEIKVETKDGEGAEFIIYIPIK